jgi:hypothetical protein
MAGPPPPPPPEMRLLVLPPVCDRCGYAHGVRKVLVMVEGRAALEQKLCAEHLYVALAAVKGQVTA